mmetsp:Transcript_50380/g.119941  ORF Transcript_50380/g.119941 Transcript_50380/m.119941 type:complete len:264 (-) Transcript_50380:1351-2142(-)
MYGSMRAPRASLSVAVPVAAFHVRLLWRPVSLSKRFLSLEPSMESARGMVSTSPVSHATSKHSELRVIPRRPCSTNDASSPFVSSVLIDTSTLMVLHSPGKQVVWAIAFLTNVFAAGSLARSTGCQSFGSTAQRSRVPPRDALMLRLLRAPEPAAPSAVDGRSASSAKRVTAPAGISAAPSPAVTRSTSTPPVGSQLSIAKSLKKPGTSSRTEGAGQVVLPERIRPSRVMRAPGLSTTLGWMVTLRLSRIPAQLPRHTCAPAS